MEVAMRKSLIWIACAAILAVAGCGPKEPEGQTTGGETNTNKKFTVVFSQCNNAEPYRAEQNKLMEKLWAEKPDVKFDIQDGGQDNDKQAEQIRTIIRQKPDLLIVAPNDSQPLTAPVKEAYEAGIPVIVLERNVNSDSYTTFVKCDNYAIGKSVGEFIVEYLKKKNGAPKGNIVQLHGILGNKPEQERNDGAKEIYSKFPGIKVVSDQTANWIQEEAQTRMTEVLNANPKIDVVYGHNDPMAIGAYLAAKEKGRDKEMIFIGIDGLATPEGGIKKVQDNVLAVTFIYPLCVDKAVEIGYKILTDKSFKPEKEYTMPSSKVGKEEAAKYKIE
jgi:ribose transport system substrate-binding protein